MRELLARDEEEEEPAVMKTLVAEIREICVYVARRSLCQSKPPGGASKG